MSRVYEALKNAQEQRTIRGPLEAEVTAQESSVGGPVHNGKTASRIREILSALTAEGAPPQQQRTIRGPQEADATPQETRHGGRVHNGNTPSRIRQILSAQTSQV